MKEKRKRRRRRELVGAQNTILKMAAPRSDLHDPATGRCAHPPTRILPVHMVGDQGESLFRTIVIVKTRGRSSPPQLARLPLLFPSFSCFHRLSDHHPLPQRPQSRPGKFPRGKRHTAPWSALVGQSPQILQREEGMWVGRE